MYIITDNQRTYSENGQNFNNWTNSQLQLIQHSFSIINRNRKSVQIGFKTLSINLP